MSPEMQELDRKIENIKALRVKNAMADMSVCRRLMNEHNELCARRADLYRQEQAEKKARGK